MDSKTLRILLGVVLVIIVMGMQNTVKKDSVAAIEGAACVEDEDCPCWGTYNESTNISPAENATAYGLGVASCKNSMCDMTYCVDIQPVGTWLKDNPWQWMKDNVVMAFGALALLLLVLFWPKR